MRFFTLIAMSVALLAPVASAQDTKPEAESFTSADGVKHDGLFYKGNPAGAKNGSCIILVHAYKAPNPGKGLDDLAKTLAAEGYHVLQFSLRGHGTTPTDIIPNEFWNVKYNADYVTGANKNPPKNTLVLKDFRNEGRDYFPFMVNDIAAARTHLDRKNDNGQVNTSSVYIVGVGDACPLGFFFITTEWFREAKKPALLTGQVEPKYLMANRQAQNEPSGNDIAGAVWISPAKHPSISDNATKTFLTRFAVQLRVETPMLFVYGEKDTKSKTATKFYYNDVLVAQPKPPTQLTKLQQTFYKELSGAGASLVGADLIGKNTGLEEEVTKFLNAVQKERKNKPPIPQRGYIKPLLIFPNSFGIGNS